MALPGPKLVVLLESLLRAGSTKWCLAQAWLSKLLWREQNEGAVSTSQQLRKHRHCEPIVH